MYRHGRRSLCYLSSSATTKTSSSSSSWDPTVSLKLNHPSLVLLERINSRNHFKQLLGNIIRTTDLISQTFPMSRLLLFSAVSFPENLDLALTLFAYFTRRPNLYIFNTMILGLSSLPGESLAVYRSMLGFRVCPDKHSLLYLLQAATRVSEVMQIHCHVVVAGISSYGYLQNTLMKVYMQSGLFWYARKLFDQLPDPDVFSFNVMILGYAKRGFGLAAMRLVYDMIELGIVPDEFTMLGLLVCCGQLGRVRLGKAVHGWMERRKSMSSSNLILCNALLDMYVKCQELELALKTFGALTEKDVVSWNSIISGCAKAGDMELAQWFFNQMPYRDLVSWNSLIAGYAGVGDFTMVRELLNDMVVENVTPDSVTMASLVSATAEIGALCQGKSAHGQTIRTQMEINAFLGSALIDMYCKCGSIEGAFMIFREITDKDVKVWTTMINGFAFHGHGSRALDLFSEMQEYVIPNEVTFVSILTACSHSGLVDQGLKIFNNMKDYGIKPGIEHYGCLVDLLTRSGRSAEAKDVIGRMPMKPSPSIWGAMLNASRAQGDVEMAEMALTELLKLEPEKEGGYMLLSNIYAASGRWSYSDEIRNTMETRGVKKTAGCSSVVVNGVSHNFVAADKLHPSLVEVKSILSRLKGEMKQTSDFLLDSMPSFAGY